MFLFKKSKSKSKSVRRIDPKEEVANAFNILYQETVNEKNYNQNNTPEYASARKFINAFYYELDEKVLEYLSAYMVLNPNGKINFKPSEEAFIDLDCFQGRASERVQFEKGGRILSRKLSIMSEQVQQEK